MYIVHLKTLLREPTSRQNPSGEKHARPPRAVHGLYRLPLLAIQTTGFLIRTLHLAVYTSTLYQRFIHVTVHRLITSLPETWTGK